MVLLCSLGSSPNMHADRPHTPLVHPALHACLRINWFIFVAPMRSRPAEPMVGGVLLFCSISVQHISVARKSSGESFPRHLLLPRANLYPHHHRPNLSKDSFRTR